MIPNHDNTEVLERFVRCCHRHRFGKGELIIRPGAPADTLYYIVDGSAAVSIEDPGGKTIVLAYLHEGEFFGEMGMFIEQADRNTTIRARYPSTLAAISYQQLEQLFQGELAPQQGTILRMLGAQLSHRLQTSQRQLGQLAFLEVTDRIDQILHSLAQQPDALTHPQGRKISVTREELGRLAGCTREMAGRALKELELRGKILGFGRQLVILDTRRNDASG